MSGTGAVVEEARLVEAAFVFAWEWSIGGKSDRAFGLLEGVVYRVRRTVPLDRTQAQAVLRRRAPCEDQARAALVLAYEGIGARREEAGFVFGLEDLNDMWRVRRRSRMSFWDAREILRGR